jgi:hypothetical protein
MPQRSSRLVAREGGARQQEGEGGIEGWIIVVVVVEVDGNSNGVEGSGR